MSIRISRGGRLFGIMAGLGGAAMRGSAGLSWTTAVFVSSDYLRSDISVLRGADKRTMLVLGFFVIAGAACFIALGSRRMRMTAGALVVLAAAAGLVHRVTRRSTFTPGFRAPVHQCCSAYLPHER